MQAYQYNRSKIEAKGDLGPVAQRKIRPELPKAKEDVDPAKHDCPSANGPVKPGKEWVAQHLTLHSPSSDYLTGSCHALVQKLTERLSLAWNTFQTSCAEFASNLTGSCYALMQEHTDHLDLV